MLQALKIHASRNKRRLKKLLIAIYWKGYLVFRSLIGKHSPIAEKKLVTGSVIQLDLRDRVQFVQYKRKVYESHVVRLVQEVLSPGDLVIDVGAHVGYLSLVFADLVGNKGAVYSFEPDPRNFRCLVANLARNKYTYVRAYNLALSDKPEMAYLNRIAAHWGGASVSSVPSGPDPIGVHVVTLDILVKREAFMRPVKLIKIDVEGHEMKVLNGGFDLLRNTVLRPAFLIVEVSKREPYRRAEVAETLALLGYHHRAFHKLSRSLAPAAGFEEMVFAR